MRLSSSFCFLMILSFTSCSLFNKDKVGASSTDSAVVSVDSIPQSYDLIDSSALVVDTVPAPVVPKLPIEYMGINEIAMIDEINLLRADPNAYIQFVDEYIQDFVADESFDPSTKQNEMKAVDELVRQLQYQKPLPVLSPDESLYLVAKGHGEDIKGQGAIVHRGSDGSTPISRIQDSTAYTGAENLVAGGRTIRETVIMLLVDANDRMGRSHRKTLLNPAWTYIACYSVGKVGDLSNTWVQLFAYDDPNEEPVERPLRAKPLEAAVDSLVNEVVEPTSTSSNVDTRNESSPSNSVETENTNPSKSETAGNGNTTIVTDDGGFSFMSEEEKGMIDEINLMRTNPKGYIPYVEAYVEVMKDKMSNLEARRLSKAAKELKKELNNNTSTLSRLQPHQKLYQVAKAHGLDNKSHNQLEHIGTDGRSSFDRVKDAGLSISIKPNGTVAPNENLAGGEKTVRNTVIALLIDSGISTRGHRKALLEPSWTYVACYNIGTIENLKDLGGTEDMDHCWIQFFAK